MRPHTRILYSLCDRMTGEARGARQKDTGSNQARALHPTAQACTVGTPALPGRAPNARLWRVGVEDIKGRARQSPCLVGLTEHVRSRFQRMGSERLVFSG